MSEWMSDKELSNNIVNSAHQGREHEAGCERWGCGEEKRQRPWDTLAWVGYLCLSTVLDAGASESGQPVIP